MYSTCKWACSRPRTAHLQHVVARPLCLPSNDAHGFVGHCFNRDCRPSFFKELKQLDEKGLPQVYDRILVSDRVHIDLDLHAAVDGLEEIELGGELCNHWTAWTTPDYHPLREQNRYHRTRNWPLLQYKGCRKHDTESTINTAQHVIANWNPTSRGI